MQGLLDDFERQGFDTKELKDRCFHEYVQRI